MGIKKNKENGLYHVSYYKRHPITRQPIRAARSNIKNEIQAKRIYRDLVIQIERQLQKKLVPTWATMMEQYGKACIDRGFSLKTTENCQICLKAHTSETWGQRTVDTITTDEIRQLIKSRLGGKAPSHQKNVLKFIRGVFKHAVDTGVLSRDPTPEMRFVIGDKIKKVLTEPQVRILLDRAKQYSWEWYPHVAMAVYTGLRNGELYALTWDKVNLEERTILVDSSWNNRDGFKSTKTGDDRMVEIAPDLLTMLQELKLQSFDRTFVLPRIDQWDKGYQARALRMFLIGLGLPEIRFHDLRATWCTIMLGKGVEPAKVMIMGGWKDLKTLMIYMRKSGISIRGITDGLALHNPSNEGAKVVNLEFGSKA